MSGGDQPAGALLKWAWARAAHWWFQALDSRDVRIGDEVWPTHVVGIHRSGPELWIQLVHAEDPLRSLVLRVMAGTGLDEALATLSTALPWSPPHLVDARGQS